MISETTDADDWTERYSIMEEEIKTKISFCTSLKLNRWQERGGQVCKGKWERNDQRGRRKHMSILSQKPSIKTFFKYAICCVRAVKLREMVDV